MFQRGLDGKIGQNGLDKNPEISAILDQGFWCTFQGPPQLQHISVFPLYYNHFSCSSPGTILMNTVMMIWLEGFLYGKICALTCTLAKKSPIIPRSRTLFRNIHHVFTTMPIDKVQDDNNPFLCCLSSIRSIYG